MLAIHATAQGVIEVDVFEYDIFASYHLDTVDGVVIMVECDVSAYLGPHGGGGVKTDQTGTKFFGRSLEDVLEWGVPGLGQNLAGVGVVEIVVTRLYGLFPVLTLEPELSITHFIGILTGVDKDV